MALLFPWATKEYLLWEMTIGQIILYHNMAIDIRAGKEVGGPGLTSLSAKELRKIRDEAKEADEIEKSNQIKEQYRAKYGDIG